MSTQALVTVVLPVFGLVGLGYAVIAIRLLGEDVANGLADFTFVVALPILLFRTLGTFALPDVSPIPLWITYFAGAFTMGALGIVLTEKVLGRDARSGVIGGLSTSYANLVMVGIPVLDQAFGEEGLVLILIIVAIHLPIMMTLSAFLIALAEQRDSTAKTRATALTLLRRTAGSLLRNAIVIGLLAGLAFRATGLPLEGVPRALIDRVADTAIPLALVSLGMSLKKYGIRGNVGPAVLLGLIKLVAMPGLVFLIGRMVMGLPPLAVAVATIAAACPTGVNAYLIGTRFQTGLALSANTITLTTAASVVSITLWLSLLT